MGLRTDGPEASEKLYALKWFFNPWSVPQRLIPISVRGRGNRCQVPDTVVGSKDKTENSTDDNFSSQAPDMKFSRDPVCA